MLLTGHGGRFLAYAGETKVTELGLTGQFSSQEDVLGLEVSVEEVDGVEVLQTTADVHG